MYNTDPVEEQLGEIERRVLNLTETSLGTMQDLTMDVGWDPSRSDALVELAKATRIVNDELLKSDALGDSRIGEKLKRWIDRLSRIAATIARATDGASYTISVGPLGGVSADVTWSSDR